MRLNKVIGLLEAGDVVFGTIPSDDENELRAIGRSAYDMLMIETEHTGFSGRTLQRTLQGLLDRRELVEGGTLAPRVTPFVRTPANAREHNEWLIKQTLDAGAFGLVLPHLDSVEAAQAAVGAARYPQANGVADFEPHGHRGWAGSMCAAPSYWGLPASEYYRVADVWPLDPAGEVLLMGIVESTEGIEALPDILRRVKGIGAIWAGIGDLSVSMGFAGAPTKEVEAALQRILDICVDAGVPCAAPTNATMTPEDRIDQGFRIVLSRPSLSFAALDRGMTHVGRG
ncbi:HpcH/HpaI aldolase family protein [Microbacterium rhizomatis]|uniref:Aldolase n=1 Tax=Microbacterium rhizomatis TaxID=1631477 RepID=A0A5J5J3E5_9MICO|nr:aldolase/citrate lyase family protein [Microbacterium rhizomatis]KAA9107728.1 aldolase [Microbacterium rhizomatis]